MDDNDPEAEQEGDGRCERDQGRGGGGAHHTKVGDQHSTACLLN